MSVGSLGVLVALLVRPWTVRAGVPPAIALDNHFTYIVLGGDHVAESVGRYLSAKDSNKTVLVLKGNRCNDVLEPSEPSRQWLEVSYLFAESAHYLGYEFIDPFLHGSKPGIAFTNQSEGFLFPRQQLYAVDPNLKMLTDARPQRIIYNKASATILGVEVSINFETHYIFAREELIIAGRCTEDYQLLSSAQVMSKGALQKMLHAVPLQIALKSPIVAPAFALNAPDPQDYPPPSKQPYYLLATELFIETLSKDSTDRKRAAEGIQPNAKVNIVLKEQPPNRWIGFNPSVIYPEGASELSDPATLLAVLMDTVELCLKLGTSETFQKLGLTMQKLPQHPECPADPPNSLLCFVNRTLTTPAYGSDEETSVTVPMGSLTEDFRLKGARKLRLLPFGLSSPFLDRWWKRVFSYRSRAREYTTRTGVIAGQETPGLSKPPMETLLEKLKERLKYVSNMARYQ
ncbi:uncharacterized protein LOC131215043 [Anopheles bellator]|uniref:uncharacterized protein LOC131215043 n=1 Tax=Anopheles bellator TaxID=139047 RepID=UPI002649C600|nr:uncharacterized protein LOC131215043 [Anopheles bellator]